MNFPQIFQLIFQFPARSPYADSGTDLSWASVISEILFIKTSVTPQNLGSIVTTNIYYQGSGYNLNSEVIFGGINQSTGNYMNATEVVTLNFSPVDSLKLLAIKNILNTELVLATVLSITATISLNTSADISFVQWDSSLPHPITEEMYPISYPTLIAKSQIQSPPATFLASTITANHTPELFGLCASEDGNFIHLEILDATLTIVYDQIGAISQGSWSFSPAELLTGFYSIRMTVRPSSALVWDIPDTVSTTTLQILYVPEIPEAFSLITYKSAPIISGNAVLSSLDSFKVEVNGVTYQESITFIVHSWQLLLPSLPEGNYEIKATTYETLTPINKKVNAIQAILTILPSLVLFPYAPLKAFTETYEWFTSVIPTRGGETVVPLREVPRYSQERNYLFKGKKEFSEAKDSISRLNLTKLLLPLWNFYAIVPSIIAGTDTLIAVVDKFKFFETMQRVLLYQDSKTYEILIMTKIGNTFTSTDSVSRDYGRSYLVPIIEASSIGGFTFSTKEASAKTGKVTYKAPFLLPLEASNYQVIFYKGFPVLEFSSLISREETSTKKEDFVESPLGVYEFLEGETYQRRQRNLSFQGNTLESQENFKTFFEVVQGQGVPFWLPSFNKDFYVSQTSLLSGATSLKVLKTSLSLEGRKFFKIKGNISTYVELLSHSSTTTWTTLYFPPITQAVTGITQVEFLELSRLTSDSLTYKYSAMGVCSFSISTISMNPENIL